MTHVKGSSFASRLRWVQFQHGHAGLERLHEAASPALRTVLDDGAVMATWYDFDLFIELNTKIDAVFGSGDLSLVRTLGRHGADANLTTIYRLFFKVGTVKWLLSRAARLWGMHYDAGRLIVQQTPNRSVEMRIVDFEPPHRIHCMAVQAWTERSVELSGGRDVSVEELSCRASGDQTCRFRINWR